MSPESSEAFLTAWHRAVDGREPAALEALLEEQVRIGAPPYWNKLEGRPIVHHLLGIILETIEDFTYHREWKDGRELALEFTGHVGDLDVQGIDLITLSDDGRVREIDVLMRPVNAVLKLMEIVGPKMLAFLSAAGSANSAAGSANSDAGSANSDAGNADPEAGGADNASD